MSFDSIDEIELNLEKNENNERPSSESKNTLETIGETFTEVIGSILEVIN